MRKSLLILLTTALALAADATGTYRGTFAPEDGNEGTALIILKQTGDSVTGTAGPNEDQRLDISNGKVSGDKITFETENSMKFELTLKGEELVGQATRERDGKRQTAKLNLKRVKA